MIIPFYHYIPSKKNSKQIIKNKKTKKNLIVSSEQYKLWEKYMNNSILRKSTYFFNGETIDDYNNKGNLFVSAVFFQKDRNGRFDLTNTIQSIEDLLTDNSYIKDDEKKVLSHYQYSFIDEKREDNLFVIFCINKSEFLATEELIHHIDELTKQNKDIKPFEYNLLLAEKKSLNLKNNRKKTFSKKLDI